MLSSEAIRVAAHTTRFSLVGLAPAQPLDPSALRQWLAAGHAADMDWMSRRLDERLDPGLVLSGARTVIALAIAYRRPAAEKSRVASYARGRDYHYAHRDRMRALRKQLLLLDPSMETYACVDTGVAMEKVWAERAGIGFIGKNGLLITPAFGSWVTLSVMFLDRAVDAYDVPHPRLCGECTKCLGACPTQAFAAPGVVDARRCIAYQSIENRASVPEPVRKGFVARVFGCDICQDVCPFNREDIPVGDRRFEPRPLSGLTAVEMAGLSAEEFARLAAGMALARARYDGFRRNALLSIGASRDRSALALVERLCADSSAVVSEAAAWALVQLGRPRPGLG